MASLKIFPKHPRLWLTGPELPAFRRKSKAFRAPWRRRLLTTLDEIIAAPDVRRKIAGGRPDYPALALGQAWQLTRDEKYARAAEMLLEGLEAWQAGFNGYDGWGMTAEAAAYLYDWFHDYWRRRGRARRVAEFTVLAGRRALDDFLHRYILDDWHNYALGSQAGALAAALAVGRDFPKLENGALLRTLHQLHFTGYRYEGVRLQDADYTPPTVCSLDAALRAEQGAGFYCLWESSGAYHSVDAYEVVKIAELWTHAVVADGEKRKGGPVWPELSRAGEALLQIRRPDDRNVVWGDARPTRPHARIADIFFHLHAREPRPEFAARLREWGGPEKSALPVHALFAAEPDTVPGAKKAAGKRGGAVNLPNSVKLDALAVMRSDRGPDAALVTFSCGRYGGWHNHLDRNGFTIYRGGALAVDSGGIDYGPEHRPEYASRTVAHNCIIVRDPREKQRLGRFGAPTVNDGGQRLVPLSFSPPNEKTGGPHGVLTEERRRRRAAEFDFGRMSAFEPRTAFDYLAGDATRAYTYPWSGLGDNSARCVEEAVRQLVFLKPEWVIVFDRVEASRAGCEKKWLLHTAAAPFYFAAGRRRRAPVGIHTVPEEGPFEAEQERGRLTVWPLLPKKRTVRLVGGPGFEAWVDDAPGADPKAGGRNFPPPRPDDETGKWRLEIMPSGRAVRHCFLTVMHAGLKGESPARRRFEFEVRRRRGMTELTIRPREKDAPPLARVSFGEQGKIEARIEYAGEQLYRLSPAPARVPNAAESQKKIRNRRKTSRRG